MKYDDANLRDLLASRYVLGTMPRRARARFDRLIAQDATIGVEVRQWAEIFAPIDAAAAPEPPPARVWRAIEARLGPAPAAAAAAPPAWRLALGLWQGAAGLATAVAVALLVYIAVVPRPVSPPVPAIVAVLADAKGVPAWLVEGAAGSDQVRVTALARQPLDQKHSWELWAIAGGAPRPLGLLPRQPGRPLALAASAVPAEGGVLAISLEPAGGSPTGKPTGPVLFQGKIFAHAS